MLIACQAWEGMYQGLHGIESLAVIEAKDIETARKYLYHWGMEASEELIYSYGLEDDYLSEFDEDDEYADIAESFHYSDRGWRGMVIKDGVFNSSFEVDNTLCNLGYDLFVEEYCEGEVE